MKAPPRMGPTTEETPNMEEMRPTKIGRLLSGTMWMRTTVDPENMPADPIPAIARLTRKVVELGAAPHRTEPISNRPTAVRNTVFVEYKA